MDGYSVVHVIDPYQKIDACQNQMNS